MKKREDDAGQEQMFQELLGGQVEMWDEAIVPPPMNEEAFARLVREGREERRRRQRLERYAFWFISAIVLCGMLLLWQSSLLMFAVLQAAVFAGGGVFLVFGFIRTSKSRRSHR
ncbi:hypothetical protein GZH47_21495 [Paenibacillus rhizovicinus]|uniref:YxlC family protein n=1 Tax=Paenibacillus rhizovicinus TaxID=2704463 RepID=A0A6C0P5Z3_9BACL|nr:DUF5345 family protein [Paenibacillus rhizovicinus]QHW33123.1 hypothetical protein GZH47_21495 [Paenibacillus rhizovicinus]